ncbi:MAG TPA: sigma-70 family RNA polymerase sigma factor [Dehalococcoidia bacterium]|nr:sigma-70 family RNA polymerase sigma factor [Dehalococcoidia bacterium]
MTELHRRASDHAAPRPLGNDFGDTYQAYYPRLFAYIYARVGRVHQTEDIVSDVFERAYSKMDSLRNKDAFTTWLFTIARNVIVSHARKSSRETIVDPDVMREISPATASVEAEILQREEWEGIAKAISGFAQREQDIISLKFDAELSNAQIAEIMDLTEPNVRVIIFRTIRRLKMMMVAERKLAS